MAVQGKLQPASGVQAIEASVPGVVDGRRGGPAGGPRGSAAALRCPRCETQLSSAQHNRDRLQNQVTINRVVLGEQPESSLGANQPA